MKNYMLTVLLTLFLTGSLFAQFPQVRFNGVAPTATATLSSAGTTQTVQLQNLIDNAGANGVTITIPSGNYTLGKVNINSNTHIAIDKDVVINLETGEDVLFNIRTRRKSDPTLENIKIYCSNCDTSKPDYDDDRYYTIDYSSFQPNVKARAFSIENAMNFHISDFKALDNHTLFSAINIIPIIDGPFDLNDPGNTSLSVNNRRAIAVAKQGDIINCSITGAAYGYGLIQIQAAVDISFKDISSTGGVTLRLESGAGSTYIGTKIDTDIAVITGIQAQNVNCTDGKVALMMSPHGRIHGSVEVRDVTANGCGFAVKAENGFIDSEIRDPNNFSLNSNPEKYKKGVFQSVTVTNVMANYKNNGAQIKGKDWKFYPASFRLNSFNAFKNGPNGGVTSPSNNNVQNETPSIAPISYTSIDNKDDVVPDVTGINDPRYSGTNEGDGKFDVQFGGTINSSGFLSCFGLLNHTIYEDDANSDYCENAPPLSNTDFDSIDNLFKFYSDTKVLSINNPNFEVDIIIYNLSGSKIQTYKTVKTNEISLSNLNTGLYIVRLIKSNNHQSFVKKILIY